MGPNDDFRLWERELTPPDGVEGGGVGEVLPAVSLIVVGCTVLIVLGGTVAGVAGLIVGALILVLWRCGF